MKTFGQIVLILIIVTLSFLTGITYNMGNTIIPPCNCDLVCNSINYTTELNSLSNQLSLKKTNCDPTYRLEGCEGSFSKVLYNTYKERNYVLDVYDCTEKARELDRKLDNLGWTSETKFVNVDCDLWSFGDTYTLEDCKDNAGGHLIVKVKEVYV